MTIELLKSRIRGTAIGVLEPDFVQAHDGLVWNGRKPASRARIVVRAASVDDVAATVRYAAERGRTVSPRGGGHHLTGIAAAADVIADLSRLDRLSIDAGARRAIVGPGVTNARLCAALARHDLAFPAGHCGSVPMSGYLIGGGIGWNSGAWGAACESVEEIELVTASGEILTASAGDNPDLFWAARGAGPGFFAIATRFTLRLRTAPVIVSAVRVHPAEAAPAVAAWAEGAMAHAPACVELSVKAARMEGPAGTLPALAATPTVFASCEEEGRDIQAALAKGAPAGAFFAQAPAIVGFGDLYIATGRGTPAGARYGFDCAWSDAPFAAMLKPLADSIRPAPSPLSFSVAVLRSPEAAMPSGSAFSMIGRSYGVTYATWQDPEDDAANLAWLRRTMDAVHPFGCGTYAGQADLDRSGLRPATHSAFAAERLARLREFHDPAGTFGQPTRTDTCRAA